MTYAEEIEAYSPEDEKPALRYLLKRLGGYSNFERDPFMRCTFLRERGMMSYETKRIWRPTEIGWDLYNYHLIKQAQIV